MSARRERAARRGPATGVVIDVDDHGRVLRVRKPPRQLVGAQAERKGLLDELLDVIGDPTLIKRIVERWGRTIADIITAIVNIPIDLLRKLVGLPRAMLVGYIAYRVVTSKRLSDGRRRRSRRR